MGDIPVLGALFRSVNFQRNLTELVVLVTPEVVAPLDVHQPVKLPTDGRTDPNDLELYLMSMLEGGKVADSTESPEDDVVVEEVSLTAVSTAPEQLTFHGPWGHAAVTE
jgi:Flp pilus assembly secretin CpaC